MNRKIEWIFFDVGGVIGDESEFQSIRERYDLESIRLFQPDVTMDDVKSHWINASSVIGDLDENVICEFLHDDHEQRMAIEHMLRLREYAPKYYDILKIRPEAKEVISALAMNYHLGLMANQGKDIRHFLQASHCFDYFHYSNVSADHSLSKPNPVFFQTVLKQAGANPHHSVIIDDNIERGLIPAKKLGMRTVWYRLQDRDIPKRTIDYTIDSLRDLLDIL